MEEQTTAMADYSLSAGNEPRPPAEADGDGALRGGVPGPTGQTHSADGHVIPVSLRRSAFVGRLVLAVFAFVLFAAALLKAHQAGADPAIQAGARGPIWPTLLLVQFELLFALWLASGAFPRRARRASLLLAATFASVALYRWLTGRADCGCFGRASIHPAWTFTFDAAMALATWRFPTGDPVGASGQTGGSESSPSRFPAFRLGLVACAYLLLGSGTALWMTGNPLLHGSDWFAAQGGSSGPVVLRPSDWVGKELPLVGHVTFPGRTNLREGRWIVIVYDHDCMACQEFLAGFRGRAPGGPPVALVDIAAGPAALPAGFEIRGELNERVYWGGAVPTEIELRDGVVAEVRVHGSAH